MDDLHLGAVRNMLWYPKDIEVSSRKMSEGRDDERVSQQCLRGVPLEPREERERRVIECKQAMTGSDMAR